jgi:hypothetical protein
LSKLSEKKVLEGLIKAHMDSLEYLRNSGIKKSDPSFIAESITVSAYIAKYSSFKDFTKLGTYTGRWADIVLK